MSDSEIVREDVSERRIVATGSYRIGDRTRQATHCIAEYVAIKRSSGIWGWKLLSRSSPLTERELIKSGDWDRLPHGGLSNSRLPVERAADLDNEIFLQELLSRYSSQN